MTELEVTACAFGSTYAFRLIAEGLMMCLSVEIFVRLTVLPLQGFEVTHPIIEFFDDFPNTVARRFSPLSAKR